MTNGTEAVLIADPDQVETYRTHGYAVLGFKYQPPNAPMVGSSAATSSEAPTGTPPATNTTQTGHNHQPEPQRARFLPPIDMLPASMTFRFDTDEAIVAGKHDVFIGYTLSGEAWPALCLWKDLINQGAWEAEDAQKIAGAKMKIHTYVQIATWLHMNPERCRDAQGRYISWTQARGHARGFAAAVQSEHRVAMDWWKLAQDIRAAEFLTDCSS